MGPTFPQNATASTSRDPSTSSAPGGDASKRGRSVSKTKGNEKELDQNSIRLKSPPPTASASSAHRQDASLRTLSPGSTAGYGSALGSARGGVAGSGSRKVRTVPPSAVYEPSTPPSPAHSPLPNLDPEPMTATATSGTTIQSPPPKQRRRRLRYSSSSESSIDTDDEDDESDDEPPWWTFTQRGMARLRAKSLHRGGRDVEQGQLTEGESGREGGAQGQERRRDPPSKDKDKDRSRLSGVFLPSSRRGSKDKEGLASKASSVKNVPIRQTESPSNQGLTEPSGSASGSGTTPAHNGKLLQPAPVRFSSSAQHFLRRSPFHRDSTSSNLASLDDTDVADPRAGRRVGNANAPAPTMQRTKSAPTRPASAPTSPSLEAPSPGMTTLVDGLSSRLPSQEDPTPNLNLSIDIPLSSQRRGARRQMTSPNFPRFFRRNDGEEGPFEAVTDSEVVQASRMSKKSRSNPVPITGVNLLDRPSNGNSSSNGLDNGGGNDGGGDSVSEIAGTSTPTRPRNGKRLTSHMLRLNIPPPITQHFTNGWPHAGSWQDALYGYYDDDPTNAKPRSSRKNTKTDTDNPSSVLPPIPSATALNQNKKPEEDEPSTPQRPEFGVTGPSDEATPTTAATKETNGERGGGSKEAETAKKQRSRRQRKYRQAMVPPTPSGLGFTPRARAMEEKEYPWDQGDAQRQLENGYGEKDKGFDWQTGAEKEQFGLAIPRKAHLEPDRPNATASTGANANATSRGGFADLARHDTNATQTQSSATGSVRGGRGRRRGWWPLGKSEKSSKGKRRSTKDVESDRRRRWRRVLFLDARVTIYIRLINLAVVVASLGLAITIRLELDDLRLPGLIGSSTTLIIAYSTLTILHVLTAIYREYFGKPIGLWGLRSKMLWVCLDLLFVALWSSAMSLATNDMIATPLECTSASAWWKHGLSSEYTQLLGELQLLHSTNITNISTTSNLNASAALGSLSHVSHSLTITLPQSVIDSPIAREACRRQAGCIALSLLALLLYGGNMVLSLFRVFETVRRTANVSRAVTF